MQDLNHQQCKACVVRVFLLMSCRLLHLQTIPVVFMVALGTVGVPYMTSNVEINLTSSAISAVKPAVRIIFQSRSLV